MPKSGKRKTTELGQASHEHPNSHAVSENVPVLKLDQVVLADRSTATDTKRGKTDFSVRLVVTGVDGTEWRSHDDGEGTSSETKTTNEVVLQLPGYPDCPFKPCCLQVIVLDDENRKNSADHVELLEPYPLTTISGAAKELRLTSKGTVSFRWKFENLAEPEFVYIYRPPQEPAQRRYSSLSPTSSQGRYLDRTVWPTLEPALEKLLNAVKYHIPEEQINGVLGGWHGDDVMRVSRPDLAPNFNPLKWLGGYLHRYNPNVEPRFPPESAALTVQCAYRVWKAKRVRSSLQQAYAEKMAEERESRRRSWAATVIQATYRGHCVRQALALGMSVEFELVRSVP